MAFKDYRDLIRLMEREMQQLSDEAFRGFFAMPVGAAGRFWQPAVDIHETAHDVVVKLELAGGHADDLNVALSSDDRVLTVRGSRTEGHGDRHGRVRCHQLEIYFGPFERSITLPSVPIERDGIKAKYKDGFLVVNLPKKKIVREKAATRNIPIESSEPQPARLVGPEEEAENEAHPENVLKEDRPHPSPLLGKERERKTSHESETEKPARNGRRKKNDAETN